MGPHGVWRCVPLRVLGACLYDRCCVSAVDCCLSSMGMAGLTNRWILVGRGGGAPPRPPRRAHLDRARFVHPLQWSHGSPVTLRRRIVAGALRSAGGALSKCLVTGVPTSALPIRHPALTDNIHKYNHNQRSAGAAGGPPGCLLPSPPPPPGVAASGLRV